MTKRDLSQSWKKQKLNNIPFFAVRHPQSNVIGEKLLISHSDILTHRVLSRHRPRTAIQCNHKENPICLSSLSRKCFCGNMLVWNSHSNSKVALSLVQQLYKLVCCDRAYKYRQNNRYMYIYNMYVHIYVYKYIN